MTTTTQEPVLTHRTIRNKDDLEMLFPTETGASPILFVGSKTAFASDEPMVFAVYGTLQRVVSIAKPRSRFVGVNAWVTANTAALEALWNGAMSPAEFRSQMQWVAASRKPRPTERVRPAQIWAGDESRGDPRRMRVVYTPDVAIIRSIEHEQRTKGTLGNIIPILNEDPQLHDYGPQDQLAMWFLLDEIIRALEESELRVFITLLNAVHGDICLDWWPEDTFGETFHRLVEEYYAIIRACSDTRLRLNRAKAERKFLKQTNSKKLDAKKARVQEKLQHILAAESPKYALLLRTQ